MVNRSHLLYNEINRRINEIVGIENEDCGRCFVNTAIYTRKQHKINFDNIIIEPAAPTPPG